MCAGMDCADNSAFPQNLDIVCDDNFTYNIYYSVTLAERRKCRAVNRKYQ
jgi:hypothetical protein